MELTISYLLKTAIVLLLLYLFYYALLRNQTNFGFNRLYLLLAPLVAMVLPLIQWPVALAPENAVAEVLQSIQLSEITVTAYRTKNASAPQAYFSPATLAFSIYAIGALLVFLKLVKQLWQVQQVKEQATIFLTPDRNVQVYQLPAHFPTFAFGNTIFLSKQEHLNTADQDKIMAHELAHVQLRHTWDVLYFELLTAVLWLNPIVWLLKQELRDVHEYQADAKVLHTCRAQEYSALLSREVLQQMGLPIGSYFQKPQVLKRLQMLNQNGRQPSWLRPLLILPLLGGLLFTFSLQQVGAQEVFSDTMAKANATDKIASGTAEPAQEDIVAQAEQEQPIAGEMPVQEQEGAAAPAPSHSKEATESSTSPASDEKPLRYVEEMPQFEGGETEMMKFLAKNIRYPRDAQEAGTEGLVVVSFNVEVDGTMNNINILKSVEESIDAEALRVVKQMNGRWSAGRQNGKPVRVTYALPVRFAIK